MHFSHTHFLSLSLYRFLWFRIEFNNCYQFQCINYYQLPSTKYWIKFNFWCWIQFYLPSFKAIRITCIALLACNLRFGFSMYQHGWQQCQMILFCENSRNAKLIRIYYAFHFSNMNIYWEISSWTWINFSIEFRPSNNNNVYSDSAKVRIPVE